jgi:hypothetical protein
MRANQASSLQLKLSFFDTVIDGKCSLTTSVEKIQTTMAVFRTFLDLIEFTFDSGLFEM